MWSFVRGGFETHGFVGAVKLICLFLFAIFALLACLAGLLALGKFYPSFMLLLIFLVVLYGVLDVQLLRRQVFSDIKYNIGLGRQTYLDEAIQEILNRLSAASALEEARSLARAFLNEFVVELDEKMKRWPERFLMKIGPSSYSFPHYHELDIVDVKVFGPALRAWFCERLTANRSHLQSLPVTDGVLFQWIDALVAEECSILESWQKGWDERNRCRKKRVPWPNDVKRSMRAIRARCREERERIGKMSKKEFGKWFDTSIDVFCYPDGYFPHPSDSFLIGLQRFRRPGFERRMKRMMWTEFCCPKAKAE
jgi:hypothetical protein